MSPSHLVTIPYHNNDNPWSIKVWQADTQLYGNNAPAANSVLSTDSNAALQQCQKVYSGTNIVSVTQSIVGEIQPELSTGGAYQFAADSAVQANGVWQAYADLAAQYQQYVNAQIPASNTFMRQLGCLPNRGNNRPCGFCAIASDATQANRDCGYSTCQQATAWICNAILSPPSPPQPPASPPPPPKPPPPPPPFLGCTDNCYPHDSDGTCDDGGYNADYCVCPFGDDCTDCGPRTLAENTNFNWETNCGAGVATGAGNTWLNGRRRLSSD